MLLIRIYLAHGRALDACELCLSGGAGSVGRAIGYRGEFVGSERTTAV